MAGRAISTRAPFNDRPNALTLQGLRADRRRRDLCRLQGRGSGPRRPVALKLLPPGLSPTRVIARFQPEARTASSLNHPTSVRFTRSANTRAASHRDGVPRRSGALEGVAGRPLDGDRLLEIAIQIAMASRPRMPRVIHQDVKPATSTSRSGITPSFWISVGCVDARRVGRSCPRRQRRGCRRGWDGALHVTQSRRGESRSTPGRISSRLA